MEFENKVLSKEINTLLYETGKTLGTAESCTGGLIAESIIAAPGSSQYFKGSIVSYVDEVKERLLGVDAELMKEKTAVCEEVACQMVKGACRTLNTTYAIAATGFAGPGGGAPGVPVGTIWLACGTEDDMVTYKMTEDNGRDKNQSAAAYKALQLFLEYLKGTDKE
ncbi:MAG: CinA family protein [Prevotella sp.]|nr:CinA family protein [Prevotella sp.]MBQ8701303.1 CinA family protein [Prevotella sp.]MBQ9652178.1 CinA family protein [Prevotella sp.]